MDLNSTDLLATLKELSQDAGENVEFNLDKLASEFDMPVAKLISVLTELEQRDEIILDVKTQTDASGELIQDGSVRLMESPPDELAK